MAGKQQEERKPIPTGNLRRMQKRAESWARGVKRHEANRLANEARAQANLEELRALGGTQQSYERVTERMVSKIVKGQRQYELKTIVRTKLESPGSALARVRRQAR